MSRLRATLSPSDVDREIQRACDRAAREVEAALGLAVESPVKGFQKRRVLRDLNQALEGLRSVRFLGRGTDPDLMSEEARNEEARIVAEQRRQERRALLEERRKRALMEQADG